MTQSTLWHVKLSSITEDLWHIREPCHISKQEYSWRHHNTIQYHYNDVIVGAMASQISNLTTGVFIQPKRNYRENLFVYNIHSNSAVVLKLCHDDVTGPLWGESTGRQWIPLTKATDTELCFLWSALEQTVEQAIETLVIWDAIAILMTSLYCSEDGSITVVFCAKPQNNWELRNNLCAKEFWRVLKLYFHNLGWLSSINLRGILHTTFSHDGRP